MGCWWTKPIVALALLPALQCSWLRGQGQQAITGPDAYARAEGLVRNRQWDDGIALLGPLLAGDPHNVKALNLAGIAYAAKGDTAEANRYFEKALAIDPHFLSALKNLSINEFNSGRYASAEKRLLSAQKQLPNDPTINLYLGQIACRQQNFKLATERLELAGDLTSHHPNASACFAVSLLYSGQKQRALDILNRIVPSDIDQQSQLALGIALAEVDMHAQAIPYLQAAFQRDPDSYDTGFDLAVASVQAKDYATAITTAQALIRGGHDKSELENVLADALASSGDTQSAIDAYRKAISLNPEDENNYLDFASLCIDHRAFEDGMKVVSLGLKMRPKSDQLTFMRGILNASEDKFDLAERDFQQAALLAPQHDFGAVGLGAVYLQQGHAEEALKIIRSRLHDKPNDANLLYLLGQALIDSGALPGQPDYLQAQEALEKSVKLNPELCLPHISLGSIYMDEDRFSEAVLQFEAARTIDPNENSSYSHLAVAYRHLGQTEKAKEVLTALKQVLEQERSGMRIKVQSAVKRNAQEGTQAKTP